jgi:hypothetical protein
MVAVSAPLRLAATERARRRNHRSATAPIIAPRSGDATLSNGDRPPTVRAPAQRRAPRSSAGVFRPNRTQRPARPCGRRPDLPDLRGSPAWVQGHEFCCMR